MTIAALVLAALLLAALAALGWRRIRDVHARDVAWAELATKTPWHAESFDPSMVDELPEPARRYFRAAIRPGAPLLPVVQLTLRGELIAPSGKKRHPMRAYELLSPPSGFVWRVYPESRLFGTTGSVVFEGGTCRASFWRLGLFRIGKRDRIPTSGAVRLLAEALLWTPASLLPGERVAWRGIHDRVARVSMEIAGERCEAEIELAADGRIRELRALAPSGGMSIRATPREFGEFEGHLLPSVVVFDYATDDAPAFLETKVERVRFIGPWAGSRRT